MPVTDIVRDFLADLVFYDMVRVEGCENLSFKYIHAEKNLS